MESFEGDEVTYGELSGRANRLARVLIERGVGPGSRVAVVGLRVPRPIGITARFPSLVPAETVHRVGTNFGRPRRTSTYALQLPTWRPHRIIGLLLLPWPCCHPSFQ
ncbi:AMP-binding protein [Streptomyces sp. NPDC056708]|uniref:AMP-binding protein n=1 Tax=unclassified Streptomyces TaxID=2593676 RepID=UPI0036A076D8